MSSSFKVSLEGNAYDMPRGLKYADTISMLKTVAKNIFKINTDGKKPKMEGVFADPKAPNGVRKWEITSEKNFDTSLNFTKTPEKND